MKLRGNVIARGAKPSLISAEIASPPEAALSPSTLPRYAHLCLRHWRRQDKFIEGAPRNDSRPLTSRYYVRGRSHGSEETTTGAA